MKTIIKIENNKEYNHIVSLHALMTNETPVEVFFEDGSMILYPSGSFVRGRVYDINCVKLKFDGKADFTGTLINKNNLQQLLS